MSPLLDLATLTTAAIARPMLLLQLLLLLRHCVVRNEGSDESLNVMLIADCQHEPCMTHITSTLEHCVQLFVSLFVVRL